MLNVNKKQSFHYDVHVDILKPLSKADYQMLICSGRWLFMFVEDVVKEFIFELQVKNYIERTIS